MFLLFAIFQQSDLLLHELQHRVIDLEAALMSSQQILSNQILQSTTMRVCCILTFIYNNKLQSGLIIESGCKVFRTIVVTNLPRPILPFFTCS